MYLLVGLGNPGQKYAMTRHNVGFMVAETFAHGRELTLQKKKNHLIAKNESVIVMLPTTFMNESGAAVQEVVHFYKIDPERLIVVHDDLDIPFGSGKLQKGKSDAGHNGAKSIIDALGTEQFWRLRIGIAGNSRGQKAGDVYVLEEFDKEEQNELLKEEGIIWKAADALQHAVDFGPDTTAITYNKKSA